MLDALITAVSIGALVGVVGGIFIVIVIWALAVRHG